MSTDEATFEQAFDTMRSVYWSEMRDTALEAIYMMQSGELEDTEALDTWIHETADGTQWVTHYGPAIGTLLATDNEDAWIDVYGTLGEAIGDASSILNGLCSIAFWAYRADLVSEIGVHLPDGLDLDDPDTWREKSEDNEDNEDSNGECE